MTDKYVLRIEIEIDGADDAVARQKAHAHCEHLNNRLDIDGNLRATTKLQKRSPDKPPRNVRFP